MLCALGRTIPAGCRSWLVTVLIGGILCVLLARPWQLRWGATADEESAHLPGDGLVPDAAYVTTRAITVRAPSEAVWPWLVQLGQGRGGFYTYDRLEQMVGDAIHSADHIVPELQQLAVGDTVPLSPVGGPKVALLDTGRALVLFETMDLRTGQSIPPVPPTPWAMDWTWSFTLRPMFDGATRVLVRTRANDRPHGFLAPAMALVLEPTHFVMERGMLLGIKRRAEHAGVADITDVSRSRGNPAQLGSRDPESSGRSATLHGE